MKKDPDKIVHLKKRDDRGYVTAKRKMKCTIVDGRRQTADGRRHMYDRRLGVA